MVWWLLGGGCVYSVVVFFIIYSVVVWCYGVVVTHLYIWVCLIWCGVFILGGYSVVVWCYGIYGCAYYYVTTNNHKIIKTKYILENIY